MKPLSLPARAASLAALLCLCVAHAPAAPAPQREAPASRARITRAKRPARDSCPALGGTVYDINRAVVAGARVRLTWDEGRKELTATTDEEGRFRVGALEPGTYALAVESNGFATLRQGGLKLEAGEAVALDVTLEVAVYAGY
ncbi:MAG TPA: carboxypeptidase-like regulatory domain-containing protein [Pyrinomonadaceae bacterium]|nr:carboxypeptidase-like regulatory domain-containing protein [Pyrinomonadaceae bacterium]